MNVDQCPVLEIVSSNEIKVFSPLLDENFNIAVSQEWIDVISESDEQVFLTIDLDEKTIVEE